MKLCTYIVKLYLRILGEAMKPFVFQFAETPSGANVDYSLIEYDQLLNLNVHKSTRQPAVDYLQEGTETFTRQTETSDSDNTSIKALMDTATATKMGESDSDDDDARAMRLLMETETITFVDSESADSDSADR